MEFQCERYNFLGFDLPESLQGHSSIRLTISPEDASDWFDSGVWEMGEIPVARSELHLNFEGLGTLVEPGSNGRLRQVNGRAHVNDTWEFVAQGSGVINVENHTVNDFGVRFDSSDLEMVREYLANPAEAQLHRSNWNSVLLVECYARLWWLERPPPFQQPRLSSYVRGFTLADSPDNAEDPDGDGQSNAVDNCPDRYNPGQDNADGDLVGDACDTTFSRTVNVENVPAGNTDAFWDALGAAHTRPPGSITELRLAGDVPLRFHSGDGLPTIPVPPPGDQPPELWRFERDVRIVGARADGRPSRLLADDEVGGLRFATVQPGARLTLRNVELSGLDAAGDGGAVMVEEGGRLVVADSVFSDNVSTGDGGAIRFDGGGQLRVRGSRFEGNAAARGGALFLDAPQSLPGDIVVESSRFGGNSADLGCDVHADASAMFSNLVINHDCGGANVLGTGELVTTGSTLHAESGALLNANAPWRMLGTALHQGSCGGDGLASDGWNFAADGSCDLGQASDLVGVDPVLDGPDDGGLRTPAPGSPLIDAGPAGVVTPAGQARPVLPCGWKDANGLGRPQDGDDDGGFECDIGAVEVAGAGSVGPGHSGAFYNPQRSGEGQYVEILDEERAVVYTFTYRPDSGPAWFLTIADIVGNSLVSDTTIRPTGTTFGANFSASAIWRAEWGGLSMVFPDCDAGPTRPGNSVYSGSDDGHWEPLVTRAQRLTHVTGCPGVSPGPMAGLSGSFYDPARSGEGLVVQWLPNGDVLAIMFTYDLAGEQFWMFGTGTPDGKSVTFDAVYPAGDAQWGGAFDPGAVGLATWGSFTLTWPDCDTLEFSYTGPNASWGSATRNYQRLSKLAGTTCPAF